MIFLAFYFSGFSALVYQICWSRTLTLIFGSSVYGQSIILALFMGGMAMGAKILGKRLENSKNPLLNFALFELLTGFFGFLSSFIPYFFNLNQKFPGSNILSKIILCSLFILPATFFMGGTFPALYKYLRGKFIDTNSSVKAISKLYSVNTLGALFGIIICNYILLTSIGIKFSVHLAACINLFVFMLIYIFNRNPTFKSDETYALIPKNNLKTKISVKAVLFVSGFLTMMYEISWSRALNFSFGSSTFTFSLIVFSFIAGLFLGATWINNKKQKNKKYFVLLMDIQAFAWLMAVIFTFLASRMPLISNLIFELAGDNFLKLHLLEITVLLFIVTPVAFCSGASFPIICSLINSSENPDEKDIGTAISFNTLGSIFGALITGFLLIKYIGPFQIIWIAFVLHAFIIFILIPKEIIIKNFTNVFIFILGIIVLFIHYKFYSHTDLLTGYYAKTFSQKSGFIPKYLRNNPKYWEAKSKTNNLQKSESELLWFKHGVISTVAVKKINNNIMLLLDGKTDASIGDFYESDMPTQSMLAFFPLLFSSENKNNGLVVGYGSGVTAGILSLYFNKIDCLEIEPEVINASKFFSEYNFMNAKKESLNIVIGDARTFIKNTDKMYDFISAEPSNIWMAGVANLFSKEYFLDCRNILNEKGVMIQWLHVYKLSLMDFKIALKTFMTVFQNVEIWASFNYGDIFFIGWKNEINNLTYEKYFKIIDKYVYKSDMERINAGQYDDFLKFRIADSDRITSFNLDETDIHTDDKPLLEFSSAKNMFKSEMDLIYKLLEDKT